MKPNYFTARRIQILITTTVLILIFTSYYFFTISQKDTPNKTINMTFETLEIMRTEEEKGQGLMDRQEICYNCGMIFVWDKPQVLSFWMKNTYVNIDIIFIDQDNRVQTVIKNPPTNNSDTTYSSVVEVTKALEIPTKRSSDLNIKVGDKLQLNLDIK